MRAFPGAPRSRAAAAALTGLVALALLAAPARAEERTVEAEGVSSLAPGARLNAARERAVSAGLANAVFQVVSQELPALDQGGAWAVAQRVIGKDARDYVTRFQVLEDRGTRPKEGPRGEETLEYVVLVEATVDARQVRERLVQAGLLAGGEGAVRRVELTLEELPSYAAYDAVRVALVDQLQADSAVPVEFTRRRVVLAVATHEDGRRLLERLAAARLDGVRVEPREADERHARAAVRATGDGAN